MFNARKKENIFRILFSFFLLISSNSYARDLSETQIYYRCHSQFVRKRPASNDSFLIAIKNKKMHAVEACMKLLSLPKLDSKSSDNLENIKMEDEKAFDILKTFQSLHMSWFSIKNLVQDEYQKPTTNLFDSNEIGYHFTYNLFKQDLPFSNVFTRESSFVGIRLAEQKNTYLADPDSQGNYVLNDPKKWKIGNKSTEEFIWKPKFINFGKLYDIRPMQVGRNIIDFKTEKGVQLNLDISKSFGAGFLGTIPYIMLSTTMPPVRTSDGGLYTHRGWSRSIFSDLLCRSLPVLRAEDVSKDIQINSNLSFRKESVCMTCHSTMDPMASVIRNVAEEKLAGDRIDVFSSRILINFKPTLPSSNEVNDKDFKFYLRPSTGALRLRTFRGELINRPLNSLADLGVELAKLDDPYVCTTKKYFEFLTGINLEIRDFSQDKLTKEEMKYLPFRQFVIDEGVKLKEHQSLKKLIENILNSSFYKKNNYGIDQ